MHSIVAGNCTVGSFSLDTTVSVGQNRGHQAEGTVTLGNNVGLDITIIVLAGPYETTVGLDTVCNHIINESVFVPQLLAFIFLLVCGLINLLENVLKSAIIFLQYGVLSTQIQWISSVQSIFETGMSKGCDTFVSVVHCHIDTTSILEFVNFVYYFSRSICRSKFNLYFAWLVSNQICGAILITKGVPSNNYGLSPAWHKSRDIFNDDWLSEDSSI